ncbi:YihY/virulence factor BrkB family protein [Nocardioides sp. P5_C9_2]
MASGAAPPPIAGTPIDPPPAAVPDFARKLDRTAVGGVGYRALRRYSHANVALLTSGTAYYLFLSLLSLLALTYGVIAILGADQLAERLTDILGDALPNLVGENGIDPQELRSTGLTAGVVGLVLLLYSTLSAVRGASSSLHVIFGAPPDPRSFLAAKARHLLILLVVTPLLAVSFASSSLTASLPQPLLDAVGEDSTSTRAALAGAGVLVGLAIDTLVMWILLGTLGGIRPDRGPRLISSAIGAVAIGLVKQLMQVIVAWSLDKPQYGAFALPLGVLFVLSLLTSVLYVCAAIAGGISDRDVPLDRPPVKE